MATPTLKLLAATFPARGKLGLVRLAALEATPFPRLKLICGLKRLFASNNGFGGFDILIVVEPNGG